MEEFDLVIVCATHIQWVASATNVLQLCGCMMSSKNYVLYIEVPPYSLMGMSTVSRTKGS